MKKSLLKALELALATRKKKFIKPFITDIPNYLDTPNRKQQHKRIKKILTCYCKAAIKKIPAKLLVEFAHSRSSNVHRILSSRSHYAIRKIPADMIRILANTPYGLGRILTSHCADAITAVPADIIRAAAHTTEGLAKILASRCSAATKEIPPDILLKCAATDEGLEQLLASHCNEVFTTIPRSRIVAYSETPQGTEKILSSQCGTVIILIPTKNIAALLATPDGIKKILASQCAAVIMQIPVDKLAAFAATPKNMEKLLTSHCGKVHRKVHYTTLYNYLYDPSATRKTKKCRLSFISNSKLPIEIKNALTRGDLSPPAYEAPHKTISQKLQLLLNKDTAAQVNEVNVPTRMVPLQETYQNGERRIPNSQSSLLEIGFFGQSAATGVSPYQNSTNSYKDLPPARQALHLPINTDCASQVFNFDAIATMSFQELFENTLSPNPNLSQISFFGQSAATEMSSYQKSMNNINSGNIITPLCSPTG